MPWKYLFSLFVVAGSMSAMSAAQALPLADTTSATIAESSPAAPATASIATTPAKPATDSGAAAPSWLFPVRQLNGAMPTWFQLGGELRERAESYQGIGFKNSRDTHELQRFRLNATIKASEWLQFFGEVQDARIYLNHPVASTNSVQDTWTLWQSYVQVGSSRGGWGNVLVGRQVLRFGDERVIGPSDYSNVSRTFNVARVDLRYDGGNTVTIFGASVVPASTRELHGAMQGNNLYGVYSSMKNVIPNAVFEPYVLWRVAPASSLLSEEVGHGHLNEVTPGIHIKGKLPANFEYNTEFDGQTGSLGSYSISAWAGYIEFGKTFAHTRFAPHVFAEGNYASGTKNPKGHDWNTFDQIYPSNHDKFGFADQFGRRNLEHYRLASEEKLTKQWTFRQAYASFWVATANDNVYSSSGSIVAAARPGTSRHVANELDFVNEVKLYRGLTTGFGYSRVFTGAFLNASARGKDYGYPYAYVEYNFDNKAGTH